MKAILDFLSDLQQNNTREWFDENRKRYEKSKEQMLFFTELMIQEIRKFDPDIPMMNPKDCLFRIFRDVRFSNDKSPYKTNMGSFIAAGGRKSDRAGYYIHLEPGGSFLGGGVWCPQPEPLKAIRYEIVDNAQDFKSIINDPNFSKYYKNIEGEKLKTAPKGFDKEFTDIDLLKYKSYAFTTPIRDEQIIGPDFIDFAISAFKELHKANQFINTALAKYL